MWYVYILQSLKDKNFYTGCTDDLKGRFKEHNNGKVKSTKDRMPFHLIYYEACINKIDAFKREKYLKSGYGKRWLKNRLRIYFENDEP